VFGVPTMSVMGVLALVGMVLVEFLILRDVNSGIRVEDNVDQVIVVFATFFSGLVLYYIAKVVQRRRGVDVTLAYREIPPE
jgi:basic amino acid/polyamine antiporter, APA family